MGVRENPGANEAWIHRGVVLSQNVRDSRSKKTGCCRTLGNEGLSQNVRDSRSKRTCKA